MFSNFSSLENFSRSFSPACDVTETDRSYVVSADLPGIKPEDVRIEFQDGNLVISGDRKEETKKEKKNRRIVERRYGSFYRSIALPEDVKVDDIQASFQDGVLKVEIPKPEKSTARRIPIQEKKTASSPSASSTSSSTRWETEKSASDSRH